MAQKVPTGQRVNCAALLEKYLYYALASFHNIGLLIKKSKLGNTINKVIFSQLIINP